MKYRWMLLTIPLLLLLAGLTRAQETDKNMPDTMPSIAGGMEALGRNIVYPDEARQKGIEGKVLLELVIGSNGSVQSVKVLSSPSTLLTAAAETAVRKTAFVPAMKDGKKVEATVVLPVMFRLDTKKKPVE
jgi:TonB family protein